MKTNDFMTAAVNAAKAAGRVIKENLGKLSAEDIGRKMASDFVTRVDKESEKLIIESISARFPGHAFSLKSQPNNLLTQSTAGS